MGIYLDNAATSFPKPDAVLDAMEDFMRNVGASSGRGAYRKALEADKIVFKARQALARLLGVRDVSRIVFTANATESLNLAIKGLLSEGDHVVTTSMEHNAVWRPLKSVERTRGVSISQALCAPDGTLDPGDVEALLRPNTKLIVMTHASNVIGTIMPVEEVGAIARGRGIPLLVDCAQTAGVYPIDVERLNIDLAAFTGHKGLMGPTGTGGLYIRSGIDLVPLKEGGTGGESILEHQPDSLPDRFEAGTLNVCGIAGFAAGVRFVLGAGVERIMKKEARLVRRLLDGLLEIPGIEVYGPKDPAWQVGVVSLNVRDIPPEEVAHRLDADFDIMVRAGLHCAPCAHRTIGTIERGTVRIGPGYFNTEDDIDRCVEALTQIAASTL
ncbi:MAG: aminotransferase class V-fold PLP-dependent enzyme [Bacillota bacterium]